MMLKPEGDAEYAASGIERPNSPITSPITGRASPQTVDDN